MAKHAVGLSEETWKAVENKAKELNMDADAVVELIVSDRIGDSEYLSEVLEELENDEAAEE